MHFICHRSGVHKSDSKGVRRMRTRGSNKIGSVCPSAMEVSRCLQSGQISVIFFKTHLGHTADIQRALNNKRISRPEVPITESDIQFSVCAVIPAAGVGQRTGLTIPKQYVKVHNKSIICHTVDAFLRLPWIQRVVVVADHLNQMLPLVREECNLQGNRLVVTEGANSRHRSIAAGVKALGSCCDTLPDVVIIHDGVRPFVTENILCRVAKAAKAHGAAGIECPLVSTVISMNTNGFLESSLDRNQYRASEMPQAFSYGLLNKAYSECSENEFENGTECLHLIHKYCGVQAKLINGNSSLWKITHRRDLFTAASVLKENQEVSLVGISNKSDFFFHLKKTLLKSFHKVSSTNSSTNGKELSNIIYLHNFKNPFDLLEKIKESIVQNASQIHILQDYDCSVNFLEFQRQSQKVSKGLAQHKVLIYILICEKPDVLKSLEKILELSELCRSLLFDGNSSLSGSVHFIIMEDKV